MSPNLISTAATILVLTTSLLVTWAQAQTTDDLEQLRIRALALVNESRKEHKLPSLKLAGDINEAALSHARDMWNRQYYSHVSPEGETVRDRYIKAGGSEWRLTAENIARCEGCNSPPTTGSVERLHEGWMKSPDHRDAILMKGLTQFGYGIVTDERQVMYAVQTFAGPGSPRGHRKDRETSPEISPLEGARLALERVNQARKSVGSKTLTLSDTLTETASAMLPEGAKLDNFNLQRGDDIFQGLPSAQRRLWKSIAMLTGACGGCGIEPTAADITDFVRQWLDAPQHKERLTGDQFTHLGFAIASNREGKKMALVIFARQR